MAKPIENNENAKAFLEHLSDAAALDEPTKADLRGLLGAAAIATRTIPPINSDGGSITLSGALTYNGSPLTPLPRTLFLQSPNYWLDSGSNWLVDYDTPGGFYRIQDPGSAVWHGQAGVSLALTTWTPQGLTGGTPSVVVNTKTTGAFVIQDDGVTIVRWENLGDDDAPNWVITLHPSSLAKLTGGNTFSDTQSNAGQVTSSVANTALATSTGGFITSHPGLPNATSILARFPSAPIATLGFTQTGITTPILTNHRAGNYYFDGVQSNAANAVLTLTIPHLEMLSHKDNPTSSLPGQVGWVLRMFNDNGSAQKTLREWAIVGRNGVNQLRVAERFLPLLVEGIDVLTGCTITVTQPVQSQPAVITLTLSTAASHRHRGQLSLQYL